jgi:hypothetical protein
MRTIFVALALLVMPSIAAARCAEVPTEPLASEKKEKAHKPINEVVEALLSDAETIYTEGAHIVERRPRTDSESLAVARMNKLHDFGESFHTKECHFKQTYRSAMDDYDYGDTIERTLSRIWDFDIYIFHAVTEAESCSNARAAALLGLARQSLDHAKADDKNWKPDKSTLPPTAHRNCINDLLRLPKEQREKLVQDQIERYRKAASSGR